MSLRESVFEFRAVWLPNVSDIGLTRIAALLEQASPLLIHGTFSRNMPMGCLASHIAWNHPETSRWNEEAGVMWLCRVAGLNPATSHVVTLWDRDGLNDFAHRTALLQACRTELSTRAEPAECELGEAFCTVPF